MMATMLQGLSTFSAVIAFLAAEAAAQMCPMITTEELGNTTAPSGEGLIPASLGTNENPPTSPPKIQLLRYNVPRSVSGGLTQSGPIPIGGGVPVE